MSKILKNKRFNLLLILYKYKTNMPKEQNEDLSDCDESTESSVSTKPDTESEEEFDFDSDESKLKMLKNLKYDYASYEIKYIYETYLKNSDEIDLNPSYQREFSWSNDKQDLFIDSIVNNYIIPPIILIKLNNKKGFKYECMDGQHRLTVLKHFIEGTTINPKSPHYIKFTKIENKTLTDIYHTKPEIDEKNLKSYRLMNEDELNAFNDKKLIVIKIANYDKKMDDVFNKIKNEMFLRLQKGERVSNTDILRNHDNIFINVLRENNLLKLNTYQHNDSYKKIFDIIDIKAKKINIQLNSLIYFVIRSLVIIHNNKLDVGLLSDNTLRDEILNKKSKLSNRFDMTKDNIMTYLDKFKKFITRIYKMKEQHNFKNLNEYFLLILLKIYLDEKDNLNLCLENLSSLQSYIDDKYYDKLFSKNINNKKVKIVQGKYLEKPFDEIKEKINELKESESESDE